MVKNTMPPPSIPPLGAPLFTILDDHWEWPNHKRVDVRYPVQFWIEEQDISQWKPDSDGIAYSRYIITPELLTLLQLRWA